MRPRQKLRIIILALLVPHFSALLYVSIGRHQRHEWFLWLWGAYSVIGLIVVILYIRRHPELRPSPPERVNYTATMNIRKTRVQAMVVLVVCFAIDLLILLRHQPIFFRRGSVATSHSQWGMVRASAWISLAAFFLALVFIARTWYRNRRSNVPFGDANAPGD
jgi:hypothetical protein